MSQIWLFWLFSQIWLFGFCSVSNLRPHAKFHKIWTKIKKLGVTFLFVQMIPPPEVVRFVRIKKLHLKVVVSFVQIKKLRCNFFICTEEVIFLFVRRK